jgi:hypothetical protein
VSTVKRVQVLGNRTPAEIEIEIAGTALKEGDRLAPQAQVLSNPDRLVISPTPPPPPNSATRA